MLKMMKALHRKERGFTLVELMVVVVIIGILVAIAIPIYNNVTANAQERACLANQRTIGGAWQMYNAEEGSGQQQTWPGGYLVGAALTAADNLVLNMPDEPAVGCNPYTIAANGTVSGACTHGD